MRLRLIVSVVVAASVAGGLYGFKAAAIAPTTNDYANDKAQIYQQNPTQQNLDQVNSILCLIKGTNYDKFTNKGPYLAQVDMQSCSQVSSGASTASNMVNLIVNSQRSSENSPQTVEFWMDGKFDFAQNAEIQAKLVINSVPTTTAPYGDFVFNYLAQPMASSGSFTSQVLAKGFLKARNQKSLENRGNSTSQVLAKGFLKASIQNGQNVLNFFDSRDHGFSLPYVTKISVVNQSGSQGYGIEEISINGSVKQNSFAYNESYFVHGAVDSSAPSLCLDRNKFTKVAYQYGVYQQDGTIYNPTFGTKIIYKGRKGWLGVYGLMSSSAIEPQNGESLQIVNPKTKALEDATFFRASGMLFAEQKYKYVQGTPNTSTSLLYKQAADLLPDPQTPDYFWVPKLVNPGDLGNHLTSLYCYKACPIPDASGNITVTEPYTDGSQGDKTYATYVFNDSMAPNGNYAAYTLYYLDGDTPRPVLLNSNTPIISVSDLTTSVVPYPFDEFSSTFTKKYAWDAGPGTFSDYLGAVNKSGELFKFELFTPFIYTTPQNNHELLNYFGRGSLSNIPYSCADSTTGISGSCSESSVWMPSFSIPDGTVLYKDGDSSQQPYFVKQLLVINYLTPVQGSALDQCRIATEPLITQSQQLSLPLDSDWAAPNLGNKPQSVGNILVINGQDTAIAN